MGIITDRDRDLYRAVAEINIDNGLTLDFLSFIWPKSPDNLQYKVSTTSIPGAAAAYLALPCESMKRPAPARDATTVSLSLPALADIPGTRNTFAWYPPEFETRINRLLAEYFELDFYKYYLRGLQYGYRKQDIIEMYLISRSMDPDEHWESLHKRAYRQEVRTMREKAVLLNRKARYFFLEDPNNPPKK
ncbi:MAG: hypothetical protein IJ623_09820 [Bacteroidales bacterium]|nr:hypothetical protein [Bacteroidales bacterium]